MDIEPSFSDYWRIILKRKGIVLGVASVVSISSFVYTGIQVPLYYSEAMIKYAPPGWGYIPSDPPKMFVDCIHKSSRGLYWYAEHEKL